MLRLCYYPRLIFFRPQIRWIFRVRGRYHYDGLAAHKSREPNAIDYLPFALIRG
jgi:hypothetical protein